MAVDFDGAASKAEHTTATGFDVNQMTVCAWVYADGQGEGSTGRIFCCAEGGASPSFRHQNAADTLRWNYQFSGATAAWTFPATDGQWNAIAITYDRSSTANNPTARVNFSDVTVTNFTAASGTATSPATGYCVGNISGQTQTWDGGIAHVQFFNRILSSAEQDAALKYPGSVTNGLVLHLKLADNADTTDYAGAQNATFTSISNRTPLEPKYAAADAASYTLTGSAATFTHSYPITAVVGSYALSGNVANLTINHLLTAITGSYATTGNAATLTANHGISAGTGDYAVAGATAGLLTGHVLTTTTAAYIVTISGTNFEATHKIVATSGAFTLAFPDSELTYTVNPVSVSLSAGGLLLKRKKRKETPVEERHDEEDDETIKAPRQKEPVFRRPDLRIVNGQIVKIQETLAQVQRRRNAAALLLLS